MKQNYLIFDLQKRNQMEINQRSASLVVGEDKVRCIYEIENSGQTFKVSFPLTKKHVNVFPVTNDDLRSALEKMGVTLDGKITPSGLRLISNKLFHELQKVEGSGDQSKLEALKVIREYTITVSGLKLLATKLSEEIASVEGGELAINECDPKGGLLKVIK